MTRTNTFSGYSLAITAISAYTDARVHDDAIPYEYRTVSNTSIKRVEVDGVSVYNNLGSDVTITIYYNKK